MAKTDPTLNARTHIDGDQRDLPGVPPNSQPGGREENAGDKVARERDSQPGVAAAAQAEEKATKEARDSGERVPQPTNTEQAEALADAREKAGTVSASSVEDERLKEMERKLMAPVSEVQDPAQSPNPQPLTATDSPEMAALKEKAALFEAFLAAALGDRSTTVFAVDERRLLRAAGDAVRFRADPQRGGYQVFVEAGTPVAPDDRASLPFAVPAAERA